MKTFKTLLLLLMSQFLLVTLLINCGSETTPELIAKNFVEQGELAAEEGNARSLRALIAETYLDQESRTKKDIAGIVSGYLLRNKNIHIFSKIDSVSQIDDRIEVQLFAAITAKPVKDLSELPSLNADIYLFELTLQEVDEWQLTSATWRQALLDDLL